MFLGLKISVHDVEVGLPSIPKAPPDHDLHVLVAVVRLNHFLVPLLVACTEAPFWALAATLLYRTLV